VLVAGSGGTWLLRRRAQQGQAMRILDNGIAVMLRPVLSSWGTT
jgi:hypothetical protein